MPVVMFADIAYTLVLLVGIVLACMVFTNAIEWLGKALNLSEGVVGSVLAAVGTALPETIVPIVAIVSGLVAGSGISTEASHDIGVGAILGAPFMLATIAMFITGIAIVVASKTKGRPLELQIDQRFYLMEIRYFFLAFGLAVGASFLPFGSARYLVSAALLGIYGVYLYSVITAPETPDNGPEEDLHPLLLNQLVGKGAQIPAMVPIVVQTLLGVGGIIALAHLFVHEVEHLSEVFHIAPLVLSLIIIPIATELPEKVNSVLWVTEGKDQLAIGNLTGAMVFQSCIPTAIGVAFTPWILGPDAWLSVILCVSSALVLFIGVTLLPRPYWVWLMVACGVSYFTFVWHILSQL
jgi:cation:H+ antiporter